MKKLILISILALSGVSAVASNGARGGGDLCEDQIQIVRDDIKSWIQAGGGESLDLKNVTAKDYSEGMLSQIASAKIRCVSEGDKFYPIQVNGTPKVCRFDRKQKESWITCDTQKFLATSVGNQYILVHHEFAGLAQIENPNEDQSSYDISNQINTYLSATIVKKLYVKRKPGQPATYKDLVNLGFVPEMDEEEGIQYCAAYGAHLPSAREWAEIATSSGAIGIRETLFPKSALTDPNVIAERKEKLLEGFRPIFVFVKDVGLTVDFYFNGDGVRDDIIFAALPGIRPHSNRYLQHGGTSYEEPLRDNLIEVFGTFDRFFDTPGSRVRTSGLLRFEKPGMGFFAVCVSGPAPH